MLDARLDGVDSGVGCARPTSGFLEGITSLGAGGERGGSIGDFGILLARFGNSAGLRRLEREGYGA